MNRPQQNQRRIDEERMRRMVGHRMMEVLI